MWKGLYSVAITFSAHSVHSSFYLTYTGVFKWWASELVICRLGQLGTVQFFPVSSLCAELHWVKWEWYQYCQLSLKKAEEHIFKNVKLFRLELFSFQYKYQYPNSFQRIFMWINWIDQSTSLFDGQACVFVKTTPEWKRLNNSSVERKMKHEDKNG